MEQNRWFIDQDHLKDAMYDLAMKLGVDRLYIDDVIELIENEDLINVITVKAKPVSKDRCEYCRDARFTDKPFTVINPRGYKINAIFNFCPYCGAKIALTDKEEQL